MRRRGAGNHRRPSARCSTGWAISRTGGVVRYVVVLSGMRSMTSTSDPEDLLGSGAALVRTTTNYTTCVREAIDTALVPHGAEVLLVGHSEGGIVCLLY